MGHTVEEPALAQEDEEVVDTSLPGWPARAAAQLRARRYARLRLTPAEAELTRRLYAAAGSFFEDDAKHAVAVHERQLRNLDDRSGFIPSQRREMYELHGRSRFPLHTLLPRTRRSRRTRSTRRSRCTRCTWRIFAPESRAPCAPRTPRTPQAPAQPPMPPTCLAVPHTTCLF